MKLSLRNILLGASVLLLVLAGAGAVGAAIGALAGGDGSPSTSCIKCHTSRENLAASLKAEPMPVAEKSSETSGEG